MTRSSLLPRAALVLLALALAAWFVLGLRAHHYADAAASFAARADPGRLVDVRRLERLYAKAESWNADPAPGIGQASLDLELARSRATAGIRLLKRIARENRGNLQVRLVLLRALAARSDVGGVDRYASQLRTLYGNVGATSPDLSIRDGSGQLIPVVTDWITSRLESRRLTPAALILAGFAFSRSARAPADRILAFDGDRLLASVPLTFPRPDVARFGGLPQGRYGFQLSLPPATPAASVRLFAVQDGLATTVPSTLR